MANFVSILPPALAKDERFRALEQIYAERLANIDLSLLIPRMFATAPAAMLPYLAEEFGVLHSAAWTYAKTVAAQRAVLASAIEMRQLAGTVYGVEMALRLIDVEPRIIEWFQAAAPRGTFAVECDVFTQPITEELYATALALVLQSKNVRSHLSSLKLITATRCTMNLGAVATSAVLVSVFPANRN